ncbi:unnamed protein product [Brassicogethes aeneus]|uniref:HORMA domain-containing protein n=1 Tax=Brassicogethes aeneus TaxID=1431903 RepID=A0A9P0APR0_BRAAE|nr:unnamed protein product [Brassicogethes aeneus]
MSSKVTTMEFSITMEEVKQSVKTFTASKRYIQGICRITLLNVLYHRLPLDEKDFVNMDYEGIQFKMFKRNSKNPHIRQYHSWVKGILDALDKNYLKGIFLYLRNADNGDILEMYNLKLQYNKEKFTEKYRKTPEAQVESTKALLNFFQKMQKCPKLGENIQPHIELTYYDDTPNEYEPINFEKAKTEMRFAALHDDEGCSFVNINTGFHKLKAQVKGTLNDELKKIAEKEVIINKSVNTASTIGGASSAEENCLIDLSDDASIIIVEENPTCICILNLENIEYGLIPEIICSKCHVHMHTPCLGFMKINYQKDYVHMCIRCNPNRKMRDTLTPIRFRLIVFLMYVKKKYPEEIFSLLTEKETIQLRSKLIQYKMLEPVGNKYKVDETMVRIWLEKLFPDFNESEILR